MQKKSMLILMRHGQSEWNKLNLFTGWVDIPLSQQGVQEALEAGKKIVNTPVDVIFTSTLIRAKMTAMLSMLGHSSSKVPAVVHQEDEKLQKWSVIHNEAAKNQIIPVYESWHLNERMYGSLQGLNKQETIDKYGSEQVKIWRRSYDVAPPGGESLAMTAERTIPYFQEKILPLIKEGLNVFVCAHGNSLRAIIMHLLKLSKEQVLELELATGEPMIFTETDGIWERK